MKYVMTWRRKRHGTSADYAEGERRVRELMLGWRAPDGVRIHQFLVRAADLGGYAVIETDDAAAVDAATAALAGLNFHIDPVRDIDPAPAELPSAI